MSCQLYAVSQYNIITKCAIVRNMCICHDEAMLTNYRLPFIFCSPVYSNTFSYGCMIADLNCRFFTNKFQVLRNSSNNRPRKYAAGSAYCSALINYCMRHYMSVIPDSYSLINNSKCI